MRKNLRNICIVVPGLFIVGCCQERQITKDDVVLWVEENVEWGSDLQKRLLSDLEKVPR